MTGCACSAASRAGQGMSYQFSKLFSPQGHAPPKERASITKARPTLGGVTHHQSVPNRLNATGTTGTDCKRPPRPNTHSSRMSRSFGGEDDSQRAKPTNSVLATTQQPHTRTRHKQMSHDKTHPTGNKRRRGRPTGSKRGQPGPYEPPHNPGQANRDDCEPTQRPGHAPVATQ